MEVPFLKALSRDWLATIGIAIFIVLLIAAATDNYIFNPFIFGGTYAVIYLLRKSYQPIDEGMHPSFAIDTLRQRLLAVSIIALLLMFGALINEADRDAFVGDFERTCYATRYARIPITIQLCEEIQGHLDNTIAGEAEFNDEGY